jgi:hypothetical protein
MITFNYLVKSIKKIKIYNEKSDCARMYVGVSSRFFYLSFFLDVFLFIIIAFLFVTCVSLLVTVLVGKGYIMCIR